MDANLSAARVAHMRACISRVTAGDQGRLQTLQPLVHLRRARYEHLKQQGRCMVHKREPPEGEEDTFEWTEEEAEEGPEPLASAESDAEVLGGAAWTPLFSAAGEHVKYQVAGLRSNQWPGAVCACQGSRFSNVYVGWGAKNAAFVPLPPPPVAKEYDAALVESCELPRKQQQPADGGELAADE